MSEWTFPIKLAATILSNQIWPIDLKRSCPSDLAQAILTKIANHKRHAFLESFQSDLCQTLPLSLPLRVEHCHCCLCHFCRNGRAPSLEILKRAPGERKWKSPDKQPRQNISQRVVMFAFWRLNREVEKSNEFRRQGRNITRCLTRRGGVGQKCQSGKVHVEVEGESGVDVRLGWWRR